MREYEEWKDYIKRKHNQSWINDMDMRFLRNIALKDQEQWQYILTKS